MMLQVLQTAGLITAGLAVLWLIEIVVIILDDDDIVSLIYYDTHDFFKYSLLISFLVALAFWLVMGILCGMSVIWQWGWFKF